MTAPTPPATPPAADRLREALADLAHRIWARWMVYQYGRATWNRDGSVTVPHELVDRWHGQWLTPYWQLSEQEKDSDRQIADEYLEVMAELRAALLTASPPPTDGEFAAREQLLSRLANAENAAALADERAERLEGELAAAHGARFDEVAVAEKDRDTLMAALAECRAALRGLLIGATGNGPTFSAKGRPAVAGYFHTDAVDAARKALATAATPPRDAGQAGETK